MTFLLYVTSQNIFSPNQIQFIGYKKFYEMGCDTNKAHFVMKYILGENLIYKYFF